MRPPSMLARFFSPGIAVRRPATIASIPARATSGASMKRNPGIADAASRDARELDRTPCG